MAAQELSFGRDKFTDKKWLRKTAKIALPLAVAGGALAVAPTPTAEASTAHSSAASSQAPDYRGGSQILLPANEQKHDTGVYLQPNEVFTVRSIKTRWSADQARTNRGDLPVADAAGYTPADDERVWPGGNCKVVQDEPYMKLLAYVGDSVEVVGRGPRTFTAPPTGGELYLGPNDQQACADNNDGIGVIQVTEGRGY